MKDYKGKVILIGAGMRKGHLSSEAGIALKRCTVILYDRLVDPAIIKNLRCKKIYVGKKPSESVKQDRINRLLLDHAMQGQTVGRLKGGDPFLFSRGFEEYGFLKAKGINVDVIPGISAFQVLAELGIPLTSRGGSSSVSFIAGNKSSGLGKISGLDADTLVFYMPVGNLHELIEKILLTRQTGNCILAENLGGDNYRVVEGRLESIEVIAEEAEISPPTLLIVSPLKRKLYGRNVLTFRQQSRETETLKKLLGFEVVNYPLYTVTHRKVKKNPAQIHAFTSPNAVESVFNQHRPTGRFISIGERTAETLREYGVDAEIPETQSSRGLMKNLAKRKGEKIMVYCSPHTNVKGYPKTYAYDITYNEKAPGLRRHVKKADILFITSSEILLTLVKLMPLKLLNQKTVVVIGPKTAATAKMAGLHVDYTLEKPLIEELVQLK